MNETELRQRLHELSEEVPEVDLGPAAWTAARVAERRRRAWLLGASGVAAASVVGAVVLTSLPADPAPAPGSSTTSGPAPTGPAPSELTRLRTERTLGVTVHHMVTPEEQTRLAPYPDPGALGLPDRLGWDASAALPRLKDLGGVQGSIRAVMLRKVDEGVYHPVLYVPEGSQTYIEVDLRVSEVGEVVNGTYPPPIVVHPDRHRIAIVQRDRVLGLDARTGTVVTVTADGGADGLQRLGWAPDGESVLASGNDTAWRLDPFTPGSAERVTRAAYPGRVQLLMVGESFQRITYTGDGSPDGQTPVPGPVGGNGAGWPGWTLTNNEGWSAAAVFLSAEGQSALNGFQGIYAVQVDTGPRAQLLVEPFAGGITKGCCTPLWWGPQDTLVLAVRSSYGPRLLAWDVINGRLWRVSELPRTMDAEGRLAVGEAAEYIVL